MTTRSKELSFEEFIKEIQNDYRIACVSRQMSLVARKEVLGGKAKFGIFGDGKEIPQIAMAKQYKKGDWRSGYYRDQTFMLASGTTTPKKFFASLYGETRIELNPDNAGRSFNNHFGTRIIDENGEWKDLTQIKCTASDISPTAGQMPRLVGLAMASKLYRENPGLQQFNQFSLQGNEVAFGTIGDGSTSEGHFFETINAAGVLQIPMAVSVWDDGYAISTPKHFQTTKESISKALKGFEKGAKDNTGVLIFSAKGWDYAGLCQMYEEGIARCRKEHVPVLFHVEDLTQPIGHSTSGSHERYKSQRRLDWEKEYDGILQMRKWMLENRIAEKEQIEAIEASAYNEVKTAQKEAYEEFISVFNEEKQELINIVGGRKCTCELLNSEGINAIVNDLNSVLALNRKEILSSARKMLRHYCAGCTQTDSVKQELQAWVNDYFKKNWDNYSAWLYSEGENAAVKIKAVAPVYDEEAPMVHGREIIRDNFDHIFSNNPLVVAFGEDIGKLGGVNQTFEGLQAKHGELRIRDTGIRESTIIGKGIGMALRGLRPIAEIQYFDYILYALQTLSDDLATTRYRTKNGQKAPLIISTRGHRLEGIWHSGSPMGMVINAIRGIYVCVPRDMTRAAGFYNTLLAGDDPGLVIEPLNAYRIREKQPKNWGEFRVPLGVPEVLEEGSDVTLVTYGSCVRIAQEAIAQLKQVGISVELIDVQTLLPFDIHYSIVESLKKTNRVVFFDEDVPGGATSYMMSEVLEKQGGFYHLDSAPKTVTAKEHRPAHGTDGDYFSNPNAEDVYECIYRMMGEVDPEKYPELF